MSSLLLVRLEVPSPVEEGHVQIVDAFHRRLELHGPRAPSRNRYRSLRLSKAASLEHHSRNQARYGYIRVRHRDLGDENASLVATITVIRHKAPETAEEWAVMGEIVLDRRQAGRQAIESSTTKNKINLLFPARRRTGLSAPITLQHHFWCL